MSADLLEVRDLHVDFVTERGLVEAVRGVSFGLGASESLAIVGESGSGKTVTSRALLGLVDHPGMVSGSIRFDGTELVGRTEHQLRAIRGVGMSMVFQDSLDSLNPVFTVGSQLAEILSVRRGWSRRRSRDEALRLLREVGIPDAERRLDDYPHQFSGGMRQRVCIAMAISLEPRVLVADEPTTALDVTVQAGILRLLRRLQERNRMALIFVTHDLAVARLVAQQVIVMHRGRIVEAGLLADVFDHPRHPYTAGLLASHPGSVDRWQDLRPLSEEFLDDAERVAPGPTDPSATQQGADRDDL